ncbi:MAG: hypothetical protein QXI19_06045, partial [Candidatus Caldarchaeum sp.]
IAASLCLSQCCVEVFTINIAGFDKAIEWCMTKDLFDFISRDVVLPSKLVNDFMQPDDSAYLQFYRTF